MLYRNARGKNDCRAHEVTGQPKQALGPQDPTPSMVSPSLADVATGPIVCLLDAIQLTSHAPAAYASMKCPINLIDTRRHGHTPHPPPTHPCFSYLQPPMAASWPWLPYRALWKRPVLLNTRSHPTSRRLHRCRHRGRRIGPYVGVA